MKNKTGSDGSFDLYNYDKLFSGAFRQLKEELSAANFELVQNYDKVMVNDSLAKATRLKHSLMVIEEPESSPQASFYMIMDMN